MEKNKLILYADDDTDDRSWVNDACRGLNFPALIEFVENGRQVIKYLNEKASTLPALIVLDLNMPEMDGRQTLQYLKARPEFEQIPVAIVTTSGNRMDKDVCTKLGASLYLIKPDTHSGWQNILRELQAFVH